MKGQLVSIHYVPLCVIICNYVWYEAFTVILLYLLMYSDAFIGCISYVFISCFQQFMDTRATILNIFGFICHVSVYKFKIIYYTSNQFLYLDFNKTGQYTWVHHFRLYTHTVDPMLHLEVHLNLVLTNMAVIINSYTCSDNCGKRFIYTSKLHG